MARKENLKISVSADTTKFQRQMAGLRSGIGRVGQASASAGAGIGAAGGMAIGAVSKFALPAIAAGLGGAAMTQLARGLAPEFNKAWLELVQIAKDALVPAFDSLGRFLRENAIPAIRDLTSFIRDFLAPETAEGWDHVVNDASKFWNRTLPQIVDKAQKETGIRPTSPHMGDWFRHVLWGEGYAVREFQGASQE